MYDMYVQYISGSANEDLKQAHLVGILITSYCTYLYICKGGFC